MLFEISISDLILHKIIYFSLIKMIPGVCELHGMSTAKAMVSSSGNVSVSLSTMHMNYVM
jgi:hypothetical protein